MSAGFQKVVQEEIARLRLLHPTPDDIPGCFSAFDDYLACNGEPNSVIKTTQIEIATTFSRSKSNKEFIPLWGKDEM